MKLGSITAATLTWQHCPRLRVHAHGCFWTALLLVPIGGELNLLRRVIREQEEELNLAIIICGPNSST
jgi:hypothetical protein